MRSSRNVCSIVVLAALSLGLAPLASGQTSTWIGLGGDLWNNPSSWDNGIVPSTASDSAIVGSPAPAVLNLNVNLGSLLVEPDGVVNINNSLNVDFSGDIANSLTNMGTINTGTNIDLQFQNNVMNSGAIVLNSTGSAADIEVDGTTLLSGGGTITLSGSINARLMGLNSFLTVDDQIIEGRGQIGVNTLALELSADTLVDANSTDNTLTIDGNLALGDTGFGVVNDGVMRASNGGILRFINDRTDNRNGIIESLAGSEVRLDSQSTIVGGLIQSVGDGQVFVPNSVNTFLENLTVDADLQTGTNVDLGFTGAIENLGSISVNSTGSAADIEIQADGATLTGGGTITLGGTVNARLLGINSFLTVGDQTIEGQGQIGVNSLAVELSDDTLVDANSTDNTLTIDGNATLGFGRGNGVGFGVVNDGVMRASNGGILRFINDRTDNRNGIIESLAGSEVRLDSQSTIVGGLIQSVGDGQVFVPNSVNTFLENLTVDADLQTGTNIDLGFTGTIANLGSISLNSTGSATDIEIQAGGANITGPGTINLSGTNARIMGLNVPGEVQFIDQTIQGDGQIGVNTISMAIRNGSVVDANVPGSRLTIDGNASLDNVGFGTEIDGVMRASNGGILRFQSDVINNRDGVIEALAGSTVELGSETDICNGIIRSVDDGQVVVQASSNVFLRNLPTPPFNFELTLDADIQTGTNVDLGLEGTINNLGTISMNSTGSATDIEIQAGGATIAGPGTVVLSGVNARINGFAPVGFEEGTLTGNGQVLVDSTFDGATISPGLSIGSLRFVSSDSTFTGGTTIRHEIQSVVDNPGVSADVIDVTGALDLSDVVVELVSLDVHGGPGDVEDFDPNVEYEFVVAIADEITGTSEMSVDLSEFSNSFDGTFDVAVVPLGNREALVLQSAMGQVVDGVTIVQESVDGINTLMIEGSPEMDVIDVQSSGNPGEVSVSVSDCPVLNFADVQKVFILGNSGDDVITINFAGEFANFVAGGPGADFLCGGDGVDNLDGGNGNDFIYGLAANDDLFGGGGDDFIEGGLGDDFCSGGIGDDDIFGEAGMDILQGGDNDDYITGGDGDDVISGFDGRDELLGNDGIDHIFGGRQRDRIFGGAGMDVVSGQGGNDVVRGGAGNDEVLGGAGTDRLFGEAGDDLLSGNGGNDFFLGGDGSDSFFGGAGTDTGLDVGEAGESSIENSAG